MATTIHSSTPPPPSSIHTPSTPRLGFEDNYQPYSPRKSARVLQRSREAKTPPPQSQSSRTIHTRSPKSTNTASSTSMATLPLSPQTASKKRIAKSSVPELGRRRVSGALTYDSTASAADSLGLSAPKKSMAEHQSAATFRRGGSLPTPAKTPVKRPSAAGASITGIARNLFVVHPDDEIMPSPKKSRKKYTGLTLDSFEATEDATPIAIFTDSNDRVPEVDDTIENPFYGAGTIAAEPSKRSSRRRMINVPGEGEQPLEDVERRADGLIYVFRGKKMFRKFTDEEEDEAEEREETEVDAHPSAIPSNLRRPLTRSSIKPKLLFPTHHQAQKAHNTEDEEADTDIEDRTVMTPAAELVATPKAPKFAPSTPPTTVRATRSKKAEVGSSPIETVSEDDSVTTSPMARKGSGKVSPFDQWQRVKPKPTKASKKREGEPITKDGGEKKIRG